jgi:uncharacterized protein with von Willebrand factor type A (vWA) domain
VDRLLASFIRALRNAQVRISTAETLDAMRAVELVGYEDRSILKHSLGLVLPKTREDKAAFEACFDRFFALRDAANVGVDRSIPAEDPPSLESMTGQQERSESAGGESSAGEGGPAQRGGRGGAGGSAGTAGADDLQSQPADPPEAQTAAEAQSALGKLLMYSDRLAIGLAIAAAGRAVDVQNIEVFTQKPVFTRKIMNEMGLPALTDELERLHRSQHAADRQLDRELTRRRDWLRERVRDYVEHQYLLHADVTGKRVREELLRTVRLANADARSLKQMQEMVTRMAKRLASLYSRRRRVYKRGQLHVPQTLRRNAGLDGALFKLRWRSTRIDRPKVFVLCDVSGSVAEYARFMLMLLHSLDEVLPKVRSFAFSSELSEVSSYFAAHKIDDAIARILLLHGGGSTDYGRAFADFDLICGGDLDRRSTVIILGDARNNYGLARSELLKGIYERSKRVLWLNPEPRASWELGDSEMQQYAAYCHQVEECGTLAQLERVVSRLLRAVA